MRALIVLPLLAVPIFCQDRIHQAEQLYQKTDYRGSIAILRDAPANNAAVHFLAGRDYFMLGEYKKATDAFQRAVAMDPSKSDYAHWLGRSFGRRAETSNWFSAPGFAS